MQYNYTVLAFPKPMNKYVVTILLSVTFCWLAALTVVILVKLPTLADNQKYSLESLRYLEETGEIIHKYPGLVEFCKTQKCS